MRVGTWSSTLRKELRLRVFQNKVLRSFSEIIGNEVTADRKNVHKKDLRALYCSSSIVGAMKRIE
jgi:hypothetical protein